MRTGQCLSPCPLMRGSRERDEKSLKTLALLGSGLILLSFTVVVINQTAGVVQLAKEVHPALGTVTLWGLLIAYGGIIGVPVVMIMRMPQAAVAARERLGARIRGAHRSGLGQRLAANKRVQLGIDTAADRPPPASKTRFAVLDEDADADHQADGDDGLPDHGRLAKRAAGRASRARWPNPAWSGGSPTSTISGHRSET